MTAQISLRWAAPGEFDALGRVVHDAIHSGPSPYSAAQRAAWMPAPPSGAAWHDRMAAQRVAIAEAADRIVGLITLRPDGYVDFAYILPEARGAGLFRRLYAMIEDEARGLGLTCLSTHASLMAQGPFAAMGFELLHHEVVERAGEQLPRAEMQKVL